MGTHQGKYKMLMSNRVSQVGLRDIGDIRQCWCSPLWSHPEVAGSDLVRLDVRCFPGVWQPDITHKYIEKEASPIMHRIFDFVCYYIYADEASMSFLERLFLF